VGSRNDSGVSERGNESEDLSKGSGKKRKKNQISLIELTLSLWSLHILYPMMVSNS
jgi:hypothetical protein